MLQQKLQDYVRRFNRMDDELYRNSIPNAEAEDFLAREIPLLDCPDPEIEEIYYFRWWVFRKHIRHTDLGPIITEFLPQVSWSGPHNSIVCASCFHIREGRWLKNAAQLLKSYILFWLDGHGNNLSYSSWLPSAVLEYCTHTNDMSFAIECLPKLVDFFRQRQQIHGRSCGLYWQDDNHDGMEFSISGPGLRSTMNSYVWADAMAISHIAGLAGEQKLQQQYLQIAKDLRAKMERLLWTDGFYKTIPLAKEEDPLLPDRPEVDDAHNVRELVGFIPWYFSLPEKDHPAPFDTLMDKDIFYAPFGLTSAEQGHPRFMEEHPHECLWNGPVWPFATSQVLVAAANLLRHYPKNNFTREHYWKLLKQYASSHHMTREDGSIVPWIDENIHPYTGRWHTRDELFRFPHKIAEVGPERGKDYNHSLYCDLILSGLLGIELRDGQISVDPLIPVHWNWFRVERIYAGDVPYRITYDRDGSHYGGAAGITIEVIKD